MIFKGESLKGYKLDFKGDKLVQIDLPQIKELEQKVAHWIKEEDTLGWDGHSYQCSICGRSIHLDTEVEDLEDYPYCHCGAQMEISEDGKWIID